MSKVMSVDGLGAFRAAVTDRNALNKSLIAELHAYGQELVAEIKLQCPEKTGALRDSIRYEIIAKPEGPELVVHVGNEAAHYAGWIEYGTSHAPAHPFVRPAVARLRGGFRTRVLEGLTRAIDDHPNVRGVTVAS